MANNSAQNIVRLDTYTNTRRYTRLSTETMVLLKLTPDHPDLFARIEDWSAAGLRLIVDARMDIPNIVEIRKLKRFELSAPVRCQMIWRSGDQVGFKFLPPEI